MPPDEAIVVGIGRYERFSSDGTGPNNLNGAVADAVDVAEWLVNVAGARVRLITSAGTQTITPVPLGRAAGDVWASPMQRPADSDLRCAFRSFLQPAGGAGGNRVARRLYVYMAGHGFMPKPGSRCLVLADALGVTDVPNFTATAWIDWFAMQYYFDELVLWMDCCAIQTFDYEPMLPSLQRVNPRGQGDMARVFTAFAARGARASYEGPIGPNGEVRGLFTSALLRGLQGAAATPTGEVTSESLRSYLLNGTLNPDIPASDQITFPASQQTPVYRVKAGPGLAEGTQVTIVDGQLNPVGTSKVLNGFISVALSKGLYQFEAPGWTRLVAIQATTPLNLE